MSVRLAVRGADAPRHKCQVGSCRGAHRSGSGATKLARSKRAIPSSSAVAQETKRRREGVNQGLIPALHQLPAQGLCFPAPRLYLDTAPGARRGPGEAARLRGPQKIQHPLRAPGGPWTSLGSGGVIPSRLGARAAPGLGGWMPLERRSTSSEWAVSLAVSRVSVPMGGVWRGAAGAENWRRAEPPEPARGTALLRARHTAHSHCRCTSTARIGALEQPDRGMAFLRLPSLRKASRRDILLSHWLRIPDCIWRRRLCPCAGAQTDSKGAQGLSPLPLGLCGLSR
jgi:hypothetical protein